jgi:hypothetical protein
MCEHEHWEQLCAMAVAGQTTEDEWRMLQAHLEDCRACRDVLSGFGVVASSFLEGSVSPLQAVGSEEFRQRFIDRARKSGVTLRDPLPIPSNAWADWARRDRWNLNKLTPIILGVMAATILLTIGVMRIRDHTRPVAPGREAAPSTASEHVAAQPSPEGPSVASQSVDVESPIKQIAQLQSDQAPWKKAFDDASLHAQQLETLLNDSRNQMSQQGQDLAVLKTEKGKMSAQLTQALNDLSNSKSLADAQEVESLWQQKRLKELDEALRVERAETQQARALQAAGSNGKTVLAARNLHIIDVYDTEGNGKRRKAFGRVFYVEGQHLIFYAYDLSDAHRSNTHFYAWGKGLGDPGAVVRLGIFHEDGKEEARWVLKFDNGGVLSKIDSLFVTAENKLDVETPHGKPVLYAVLTGQANHP